MIRVSDLLRQSRAVHRFYSPCPSSAGQPPVARLSASRLTNVALMHDEARDRTRNTHSSANSQHKAPHPPGTFRRYIIPVVVYGAIVVFLTDNFYTVMSVEGGSMSPSLHPDPSKPEDIILLNRRAASTIPLWPLWNPERKSEPQLQIGDVVTLWSPLDPNLLVIKRILALPGDFISLSIHPKFPPPFLKAKDWLEDETPHSERVVRIRIPEGHMWVEGDATASEYRENARGHRVQVPSNRKSRDSRHFGPVPLGLVTARVDAVLFPPSRFGAIPGRPNFDVNRARELRLRRMMNQNVITVSSPFRCAAHPDDSNVSPYSDWEWITDSSIKDSDKSKQKRNENQASRHGGGDDARSWKESLNLLSRGGRLGEHVDYGEGD